MGEGNPPNFTQKKLDQNIIFNYNNNTINDVMNMINDNEKSMNNDNKNGNQKMKKNKKKKKKKIDNEIYYRNVRKKRMDLPRM